MSREEAIEDLIKRLAAATAAANELGLDLVSYLLGIAMLESAERSADNPQGQPAASGKKKEAAD